MAIVDPNLYVNYYFALLLVTVGTCFMLFIHYTWLFTPTQWLTPVGKTILVTGCDSGVGHQLAKHFAHKGSHVIATVLSTNSDGAQELMQLKGELNEVDHEVGSLELIQLDLSDESSVAGAVDSIKAILRERNDVLHALINNAGVLAFGEFDFLTTKQIKDQVNINLVGPILLTKLLLPWLINKPDSRIVNVSSVNAVQPFPGISVYSATKGALESFSASLRMELCKFNCQVVCLRLGDYARLTNIMSNHNATVRQEQYSQMDDHQRSLYATYFDTFHDAVVKNYGFFSPPSFELSPLFDDFEEAVLAKRPRRVITSATFVYKVFLFVLALLPTAWNERLIAHLAVKYERGTGKSKTA